MNVRADIPPSGDHVVAGVEAPAVAVPDPSGFQRTIRVEEILHTVDGLCAGKGLTVLIVEPRPASFSAQLWAVTGLMVSLI